MRQMDTILVAVGVPTKEVPGAVFALPQPVTITKVTDNPDQSTSEQQVPEIQKSTAKQMCIEESENINVTEETCDGWDIPDISDLLDSLNDTESENQITERNNLPLTSEESATNNDAVCDAVVEAEADSEHMSWSWDDAHWKEEHTQTKQPDL